MKKCWKDVLAGVLVAIVALAVWMPQLRWGLPSREADRWLFGGREAWSGAEVLAKLPNSGAPEAKGADVDSTPILDRSKPVVLNDTDAKRAAIVQRFRLMSGQPDEFIQFKALAEMAARPGFSKLDPRLYQYGGLWIYPVGGLVRTAMAVGWIESPPSGAPAREFYLDRPETFAKFYVVARAYSMSWGVVAAIAVYLLARNVGSRDATPSLVLEASVDSRAPATALRRGYAVNRILATLAAIAFVLLPSVQTSAREAKPHLAGAALCLLATLAASLFVTTGKRRWLLIAGALCGAAMGMVVSMVLAMVVLPVAAISRTLKDKNPFPRTRGTEPSLVRSLVAAIGVAVLVYVATNPFVVINAVVAPHLLRSNLGNSTAMYGVRGPLAMIPDALRIAGHAMTPLGFRFALATALAAVVARIVWHRRPVRLGSNSEEKCDGCPCYAVWVAPAVLVATQFVLLAAGKPAEYARFGLVVWAALCAAAAIAMRNVIAAPVRCGAILLVAFGLCLLIPPIGLGRRGYDAWQWTDGDESATQLETMRALGDSGGASPWRLGVAYEPAPWSTPPINLFDQEIVLVRATPAMLDQVDAFVWPVNLESQCIETEHDRESLDWRLNRFGHRAEARDGEEGRWRGGW